MSPATLPLLVVLAVLVAALPWPWFIAPLAGVVLVVLQLAWDWAERRWP